MDLAALYVRDPAAARRLMLTCRAGSETEPRLLSTWRPTAPPRTRVATLLALETRLDHIARFRLPSYVSNPHGFAWCRREDLPVIRGRVRADGVVLYRGAASRDPAVLVADRYLAQWPGYPDRTTPNPSRAPVVPCRALGQDPCADDPLVDDDGPLLSESFGWRRIDPTVAGQWLSVAARQLGRLDGMSHGSPPDAKDQINASLSEAAAEWSALFDAPIVLAGYHLVRSSPGEPLADTDDIESRICEARDLLDLDADAMLVVITPTHVSSFYGLFSRMYG